MPQSDYLQWLFGKAVPKVGIVIGAGGLEYTYTTNGDVIDYGTVNPNVGGLQACGLHFVTMVAFTGGGITGAEIWVVHGASATPTTKMIGRYFATADLVAGHHYFIPMSVQNLEFVAGSFLGVGGNPTAGKCLMWIGPDEDGTE